MASTTTAQNSPPRKDKFKHSATGLSKGKGGPKKGGAGKGGWGKPGDELNASGSVDPDDPNYDSAEEVEVDAVLYETVIEAEPEAHVREQFSLSVASLQKFKTAVRTAVDEYLSSGDKAEFVRCVRDLNAHIFHQELPKIAIQTALDKTDEARNRIAVLLQYISEHDLMTRQQLESGFQSLFNRIADLSLDAPDAEAQLKKFLSRAVAAELLSEAFANDLLEASAVAHNADAVRAAKQRVSAILDEYFSNGDLTEASRAIAEMKAPHFQHELVKQGISKSMDKTDRERELTSQLIAVLSGDTKDGLRRSEVEKGFEILLQRVDDIFADVPNALQYLSCFLARAVADESLPPAFLTRVNVLEHDMGYQVVQQAQRLLKQRQAAARLATVWGPGDGRSVSALKEAIKQLVAEYLTSEDVAEAKKCVKDLGAPLFLHELVARLINMSVDGKDRELELAIRFIKELLADQILPPHQYRLGLERVERSLPELQLDAPHAPLVVQRIRREITA